MNQAFPRPNIDAVLHGLKDFQRDTVDYVFKRMYVDPDLTRRFLVADEVGLGKTLVARGLIACTIDHLWDDVDRIDVVYICSNSDIARQNVNRLNVGAKEFSLASRITLLPLTIRNLKENKVNFISFTPSTSFDLRSRTGVMEERALLYWLLDPIWHLRGRMGPLNVLQDEAGTANFRQLVSKFQRDREIDSTLAESFRQAVLQHDNEEKLRERFEDLCSRFARQRRHVPTVDRKEMREFIARLRRLLAQTCLGALEPDLIILDEFQRFKHLLGDQDQASALAQELFNYADENSSARVLLLSATPYKMMSFSNEAQDDDHYTDFVDTLKFLQHDEIATQEVAGLLRDYRRALYHLGDPRDSTMQRLRVLSQDVELQLRRVMVRTKRLAASEDRNGMLTQINPCNLRLERTDVQAYVELQQAAKLLNQGDTLEYWKSAPYLFNFMEGYKIKTAVTKALDYTGEPTELSQLLERSSASLFPLDEWRAYQAIDPGNARLRQLQVETIDGGLWQLLWLPSSLPYYQPAGVFADADPIRLTKRLIFSSWVVAPKVIAALTSYEAERRMMRSFGEQGENSPSARRRIRSLLRFTRADGRLTGMPVLGLLYPSIQLARDLDPIKLATEFATESGSTQTPTLDQVMERAVERVDELLSRLPSGDQSGPEDESWYWAAPILLDNEVDPKSASRWLNQPGIAGIWSGKDEELEDVDEASGWTEHVGLAQSLLDGDIRLGRRPADLTRVIAQLGIAGPGVVALRSLCRQGEDSSQPNILDTTRSAASHIAWAFRSLFNVPEVMMLVRSQDQQEPYWRRVLDYCVDGGLQATLDEYFHVLYESLGLMDQSIDTIRTGISDAVVDALTLRSSVLSVDELQTKPENGRASVEKHRMRVRFAVRFGDQQAENDKVIARASQVRTAFNSPFWPFILATTSVGQEGLDFHLYCHAVVHWNLPANPVDLEQREGRVHRYKGHAIRKNLAKRFHTSLFESGADSIIKDPWEQLFNKGKQNRAAGASDSVPYWIYPIPGGAQIERHVPTLPLSRDRQRLDQLLRSLRFIASPLGSHGRKIYSNFYSPISKKMRLGRPSKNFTFALSPKANINVTETP